MKRFFRVTGLVMLTLVGCRYEWFLTGERSWFLLTLSFELLLGRFMMKRPWREILQVFNVGKGDLFSLVLIATLVSPWLAARLRGLA